MVLQRGYSNRSLALSDMIRAQLVEHQQTLGGELAEMWLHIDHSS